MLLAIALPRFPRSTLSQCAERWTSGRLERPLPHRQTARNFPSDPQWPREERTAASLRMITVNEETSELRLTLCSLRCSSTVSATFPSPPSAMPKHQLLLDSSSLSLAARLVAIVAGHTPSNLTLGNAPVLALGSNAAAKEFDVLTALATLAPTKAGATSAALQLGGATDAERKQVADWAAILAAESTPLSAAFLERLNAHLLTASFLPVSAYRPTTVDYAVWAAITNNGAAIDGAKLPNLARWERAVVASVPRIGAAAEVFLKGTTLAVEHAAAVSGAAAAAADAAIEASLPHSAIFDIDVAATAAAELKGRVTASAAAAPAAASSSSAPAAAKKGEEKAAAAAAPKAAAAAGGAAAPAKEKAAKPAKEAKAAAAAPAEVSQVYRVDFRVGRITSVTAHPTEARLYVEQIDVGAECGGVRTVVSGLAEHFKPEDLLNRLVVVMVNVKSGDMKGVESAGRVMVATSADGKTKELASPPEGAKVGEQVSFADVPASSKPDQPIAPKRLHEIMSGTIKHIDTRRCRTHCASLMDSSLITFTCLLCLSLSVLSVLPFCACSAVFRKHLHTNAQKVVQYANTDFQTSAGPVTVPTIADGTVA